MTDKTWYVRILLSQQASESYPVTIGAALYTQNIIFQQNGISIIIIPAEADPSTL